MERRPELRIALLGDSGTGKTEFFEAATDEEAGKPRSFLRRPRNETTIGADFRTFRRELDDQRVVTVQLWDTAGQERFASIVRHYYRNHHVFVLMYDLTVRATFDNLARRWLPQLEQERDSAALMIVGNKSDKLEENGGKCARAVSQREAAEYAAEIGATAYELSSLTQGGWLAYKTLTTIVGLTHQLQPAAPRPAPQAAAVVLLPPTPRKRRRRCALQ